MNETQSWTSVTDLLPPDKQDVLLIHSNGLGEDSSIMAGFRINGCWYENHYYAVVHGRGYVTSRIPDEDVTHWMGMPATVHDEHEHG